MYLKTNNKYSAFNSQIAQNEKNDCFVRSLAVTADVDYDTAHQTARDIFKREDKKGTMGAIIAAVFLRAADAGYALRVGKKEIGVEVLSKSHIKNKYKLKGEIIWRKKTLKSFIESHKTGSYIVTVSGHALAVKDGELMDWDQMAYLPTRKVLAAYRVTTNKPEAVQLSLF
jgi:hypothetical protein